MPLSIVYERGPQTPPLNKQRKYQAAHKAAGRCHRCSQPATEGLNCAKCAEASRQYNRKRYDCQPWQPGQGGRRPLSAPLHWVGVDWTCSNANIARRVGCHPQTVLAHRRKMGLRLPRSGPKQPAGRT